MNKRDFYIVCYDIENTKIRNKLVKYLKKFGIRRQKSVFQSYLNKKERIMIFDYFIKIKNKNDKIAFIQLCYNCQKKIIYHPKLKIKNFAVI